MCCQLKHTSCWSRAQPLPRGCCSPPTRGAEGRLSPSLAIFLPPWPGGCRALLAVLQHRAAEDTLHPWPPCQRQAWWGNELRLGRVSFLINKDSQQPTLGRGDKTQDTDSFVFFLKRKMHLILSTDARERVLLRSFCKVEARKENTFTPVRLCVGGRGVAHTHVQGSQQLAASLGTESPSLKTTRPTQSTIFILF